MQEISTDKAPTAIGPYSQAIKHNDLVFCSGQIPLRASGNLITGSIEEQTKQVMENLQNVLQSAGTNLNNALKITIYLKDMEDFPKVNEIYGSYFSDNKPARACVGVSSLPKNVDIEIDCIAKI